MALTATQAQQLIILRVGDTTDGVLAANIALLWASHADKASILPRLQEAYTERDCWRIVAARVRTEVDFAASGDIGIKANQQFTNAQAAIKELDAAIAALEARGTARRGGVVAPIVAVAPETPPTGPDPLGPPDGNSERYQGDVYRRIVGPRGVW